MIDIGGGSTECIIGERFDPISLHSLYMGCVGYTAQFFANGKLSRANFERAQLAAALELASLRESFRELGWSRASGSSGTILAVSEVLRVNGWSHGEIHLDALRRLVQAIQERETLGELSLPGLEADRAAVFPGGVAILVAAFEQLGIEVLEPSSGALREGIVYELLDRPTHEDPRDRSIATVAARYKVDAAQAQRVEETALAFFDARARRLEARRRARPPACSSGRRACTRSASRSPTPATTSTAPTSSSTATCPDSRARSRRCWRRWWARTGASSRASSSSGVAGRERRELALRLALLLRLAVRLHHSRSRERLPDVKLRAGPNTLTLVFPRGWLEARPLTRADLEEEAELLAGVGFRLRFPTASRGARAPAQGETGLRRCRPWCTLRSLRPWEGADAIRTRWPLALAGVARRSSRSPPPPPRPRTGTLSRTSTPSRSPPATRTERCATRRSGSSSWGAAATSAPATPPGARTWLAIPTSSWWSATRSTRCAPISWRRTTNARS